jgi:hypothetical protein
MSGRGCAGYLRGLVGGVIVDNKQLPVLTEGEAGLGLCEQGIEAGAEGLGFIARRHDDGEPQLRLRVCFGIVCRWLRFFHRFVL